MTWLTWRQFRPQAITAAAGVLVLAILLAATGPHLVTLYDQAGLNSCHADCATLASKFTSRLTLDRLYVALFYGGIAIMYLVPALIGIFWGAPLIAREFETGTYRLSWNQSVTTGRWAVVKLCLIGLASVATAGLLSLIITWWARPIDDVVNLGVNSSKLERLSPLVFGARGVAPLGYAAFAFALGVTAGVLIRRTMPAMAITLVIFAAVQFLVPNFVRPNIIPPEQVTAPFNPATAALVVSNSQAAGTGTMTVVGQFSKPGAWILSNKTITPNGTVFDGPPTSACMNANPQPCNNWLASKHLRQLITYQPASRFWPLQWLEFAMYLILAAALGWVCAWQVQRRRN